MNLKLKNTRIPGCFELQVRRVKDERGVFVKAYHRESFAKLGLRTDWVEQYYSISEPCVVRGLHFQTPPHEHAKLVFCTAGKVIDIGLDLRRGSPTYGEHVSVELSADQANMLYLPPGLAHGFSTLDQPATLVYNVTSLYHPQSDTGIQWDSAGIDWPHSNPQLSERDQGFMPLTAFDSPFEFDRLHLIGGDRT